MLTSSPLPPWPTAAPAHGAVLLRRPVEADAGMARALATDPYVPLVGTLPARADDADALAWIRRQQQRHEQGAGFSFTIVEASTGAAVGNCGLWLRQLDEGRASAGYAIAPAARGRGLAAHALVALTTFGWTIPDLHRIELYIEPWNLASVRSADRAGYLREGLLRSHQQVGGARRDMLLYASIRAELPVPARAR